MHISQIKKEFAIFENQPDLVYLDSAATSLTPRCVVDKITEYYEHYNANIARGVYDMSERATAAYEESRDTVAQFVGAQSDEIIFTSGATMSLNMIARGLGDIAKPHSNIVVTAMEHHANFVPWQRAAQVITPDATTQDLDAFRVIDVTSDGTIDCDDFERKVNKNTTVLALTHTSNVLGTVNPIKELIARAKKINPEIITVVDAAQSAAHRQLDVNDLDCDFLALSAHKMYGPTGVGVLYGKKKQLERLAPLFTGGEMVDTVTQNETTFKPLPHRLEAGTPNIADVIALGEAIHFIKKIGFSAIQKHDQDLTAYAREMLHKNFGNTVTIYGPTSSEERSSIISFSFKGIHPHDIAAILDSEAHTAIRAGQHCTMPLHLTVLGIEATARASFGIYNTKKDIDVFIDGLKKAQNIFTK